MTNKEPLPTVNQTGSFVDEAVGDIVKATEIPVEAAIIAAAPIMATPIWMQIWEKCLDIVFQDIGGFLGKYAGYKVIDIEQYFALKKAVAAQAAFNAALASKDQNAINKANSDLNAAIAPALHYIGTV